MAQSSGQSSNILGLVNNTIELPTMPEVLVKLNEVIASADASAADVANVVSKDPSVATNILRIVNSAYYGLQVRVSSVSLAVSVMGFNMTKKPVYMGPGAPAGPRYHHYIFEVYALNANLDIPPDSTREAFFAAMAGKTVAKAAYVGRFRGEAK